MPVLVFLMPYTCTNLLQLIGAQPYLLLRRRVIQHALEELGHFALI